MTYLNKQLADTLLNSDIKFMLELLAGADGRFYNRAEKPLTAMGIWDKLIELLLAECPDVKYLVLAPQRVNPLSDWQMAIEFGLSSMWEYLDPNDSLPLLAVCDIVNLGNFTGDMWWTDQLSDQLSAISVLKNPHTQDLTTKLFTMCVSTAYQFII